MEKIFDITIQNRKILYKILKRTPPNLLFEIPEGYRNNIWWNIAHVVATQQILIYKFSNLTPRIDDSLIQKFRKGTLPDLPPTDEEIDHIGGFLFSTVEWTQQDYENGIFKEYNEYTTSTKVVLSNVEDALKFNLFHEGLHLGVILSLDKILLKEKAS
ncbi:MAG: DinB family protein [Eudoraea sp.]|nr:DinB family protein [Eudoraea sp.]MBT8293511.1 DinB family protein [Eudoraea sp.]